MSHNCSCLQQDCESSISTDFITEISTQNSPHQQFPWFWNDSYFWTYVVQAPRRRTPWYSWYQWYSSLLNDGSVTSICTPFIMIILVAVAEFSILWLFIVIAATEKCSTDFGDHLYLSLPLYSKVCCASAEKSFLVNENVGEAGLFFWKEWSPATLVKLNERKKEVRPGRNAEGHRYSS